MIPERDYYEVLEVSRDADAATIKRSFLKKARELHPDVSTEPDAEIRFKEVNEAYAVLSDDRKRANYDRYGDADGPGGFGSDYVDMSDIFSKGGFGFSDILDSFFGVGGASSGRRQTTGGRNMSIRLSITLEEAATGCTKTVAYNRLAPCDDCNGTGKAEGAQETVCDRCHGSGRILEVTQTVFGRMQSQSTCPVCGGAGRVIDKPCETCQGQGRAPAREKVEVTIEKGIHSGQRLEIIGKGEAGSAGMPSGNLLVSVDIAPHERFERTGDDLHTTISIDSIEAMVGCKKTIPGILEDEQCLLKIPKGVQYGDTVLAKGFGMPRQGMDVRGSLIAHIQILTPVDLTKKQRQELKKLALERQSKQAAPRTGF